MNVTDEIFAISERRGGRAYFGEPVSHLEHGLKAGPFAQQEDAPPHLVIAALLHDVVHLLDDIPENIAEEGIDAKHENLGRHGLKNASVRQSPSRCFFTWLQNGIFAAPMKHTAHS